jgi:phospholipid/cholesterol/gamma-HCH transport system substrate-binding protein
MIRFRHADEFVGLLVLIAVALLLAAILQAGFLGRWFQPSSTLRILLPATGGGGLARGADVQVLGTSAGKIGRIVINPKTGMYALAEIDEDARDLIPRDSKALIRRQFGIAGAAFIEIQPGSGAPMDWGYAVIDAALERAPTDNISALIDETREKVFPILSDTGRATHALADLMERANRGEGSIGRAMVDETAIRSAETALASSDDAIKTLGRLLTRLDDTATEVGGLVKWAGDRKTGVPALFHQADQLLAGLRPMIRDLGAATTRAPTISRNMENTSENLPSLLLQTQATAGQLEKLLIQLRGHWLLGGGGAPPAEDRRLAPTQARP